MKQSIKTTRPWNDVAQKRASTMLARTVGIPGRPGCPNVGFSYSWNTAALTPGSHTVKVLATDTDYTPDTGSASITVTVAPTPPSVNIDLPSPGATVSGTVTIAGDSASEAKAYS